MPDPAPAPGSAEVEGELAVGLAASLRAAGLEVPVGAVVELTRALAAVGIGHRDRARVAARSVTVRRPDDMAAFEAGFAAFWDGADLIVDCAAPTPPFPLPVDEMTPENMGPAQRDVAPDVRQAVRYSSVEMLRHLDIAACTADELDEVHQLMRDLRLTGWRRVSRRRRSSRRGDLDLRRTVRRAVRHGGEVVAPLYRSAGDRPRRLVVLVDISGSMAPYSRTLLRFLHGAVAGAGQVEAFAVGTRTTRLTPLLDTRDPDAALAAAAGAVPDWSGGTRLGEGLRAFLDTWGARGPARGAVVLIASDGWDRGDASLLGDQMERLARIAHRIVWVNPLMASDGYAPLAAGMAAALPHVDDFLPGHSLAALDDIVSAIDAPAGRSGSRRRRNVASKGRR